MTNELARKLQIRPNHRVRLLNAPPEILGLLSPLPAGAAFDSEQGDVVLLFVQDQAQLNRWAAHAFSTPPHSVLWIAYPKRTGSLPTDLTRDAGWAPITKYGLRPVAQISIDDTWSAVRWRPDPGMDDDVILATQYRNDKAALLPIYHRLVELAQQLGDDVQVATRQSYVALARSKQFAVITPRRRDLLELGLKFVDPPASARLSPRTTGGSGSMTHSIALHAVEHVDAEIERLLGIAYGQTRP